MKVKFKLTDFINNDIETLTSVYFFTSVAVFWVKLKISGGASIIFILSKWKFIGI